MREWDVENTAFTLLKGLGYGLRDGPEVAPGETAAERTSWESAILTPRLRDGLSSINTKLPATEIEQIIRTLARPPHPTLIENNRWFHGLLTDGVPVEYRDPATGETRGGRGRLIDFDKPANNAFLVVRQFILRGANGKTIRPDLLLFVNGLPLVVIELKDPANATADLNMAIDQLGRYKQVSPELFVPNLLLAVSDGLLTRVGSITSGRQRFTPWRPAAGHSVGRVFEPRRGA